MSAASALREFRAPVAVTLAYLLVFYALVLNVVRVKNQARKAYVARSAPFDRYAGEDRRLLTADRCMLNMLEHMPAFLTLFWLNAVFVDTTVTSIVGALYVVTRIAYPFLMGPEVPPRLPLRLLVSTYTGYVLLVCLAVMLGRAWWWA